MPDIELALTGWARTTFGVTSCTSLPANLADVLPVIQVTQVGGLGTRFSDEPRADVDVYAATYEEARDLAQFVHTALMFLRGTTGDLVVRNVSVSALPSERPYDNPAISRIGSSYLLGVRPNSYA